MIPFQDLTNQKFSRLLVVRKADPAPNGRTQWVCRCDCGREATIYANRLKRGNTTSCGCAKLERVKLMSEAKVTHGCARNNNRSAEYKIWTRVVSRTTNPKNPGYVNYGGRGIHLCRTWLIFENFLRDMGERPSPNHTLERKNNNLGYEPENCCWATRTQQQRNRRNTVSVTYLGENRPLAEWAEIVGIKYSILWKRINELKIPTERAMTQLVRRTRL